MLTMMVVVIILKILVMKTTKNWINTMAFYSKCTHFRHFYLAKKGPKQLGRSQSPHLPQTGKARLKYFFFMDFVPKSFALTWPMNG